LEDEIRQKETSEKSQDESKIGENGHTEELKKIGKNRGNRG
jgi:hypothetical protein